MPCCELFDRQPLPYRRAVIPIGALSVSVEAASALGWQKYSHLPIAMSTFGASAPIKVRRAEEKGRAQRGEAAEPEEEEGRAEK